MHRREAGKATASAAFRAAKTLVAAPSTTPNAKDTTVTETGAPGTPLPASAVLPATPSESVTAAVVPLSAPPELLEATPAAAPPTPSPAAAPPTPSPSQAMLDGDISSSQACDDRTAAADGGADVVANRADAEQRLKESNTRTLLRQAAKDIVAAAGARTATIDIPADMIRSDALVAKSRSGAPLSLAVPPSFASLYNLYASTWAQRVQSVAAHARTVDGGDAGLAMLKQLSSEEKEACAPVMAVAALAQTIFVSEEAWFDALCKATATPPVAPPLGMHTARLRQNPAPPGAVTAVLASAAPRGSPHTPPQPPMARVGVPSMTMAPPTSVGGASSAGRGAASDAEPDKKRQRWVDGDAQ